MAEFTKERIIEEMKASTQNTSGMFEISEDTICALMSMLASPPAPVSVPAAMEIDDDFDSAFEHGKAVGWNAYRAAMLQAEPVSNSDELPLDYLQGHKDGLEWAAQLAEANHPQTGDWLYDDPNRSCQGDSQRSGYAYCSGWQFSGNSGWLDKL